MKNILTLTDFSSLAEMSVEAAYQLAKNYDSSLTIYHHMEKGELISYELDLDPNVGFHGANEADGSIQLNKWIEKSNKMKVSSKYLISADNFLDRTAAITEKLNIDLIVMGSTGAGGKREYIWGSNTEKVVKSVDCPVLVIKRPLKDYKFDNIVFASSFDINQREVFTHFLNLMDPPKDAIIHLLAIDTTSYFSQPTFLMKQAMREFEELAKPWNAKSYFYSDYSIDAGIRHFMDEVQPDLLVMSNKFNRPLKHAFQGNQAIRMVNHSDFPVLTIDYRD